jgi:hypothetical protein
VRRTQRKYEQKIQELARAGDKTWHAKILHAGARSRAKRFGVPFTISHLDVVVPDVCPALGIPLKLNRGKMAYDSATIDRIDPSLGYVPGNVIVVSNRANGIKNAGTATEILRVGAFYAQLTMPPKS